MGNLPLKRDSRFHQGYFRARNPDKIIGKDPVIFRSKIEYLFLLYLDKNENVKRWNSESIIIPYFDKVSNKNRKYYTDCYVEIVEGSVLKKYIIELKDIKETKAPNPKSKKKKASLLFEQCRHITNVCKWEFANEYAKRNNVEFMLIGYSKKNGFEHVTLDFK